MLLTLPQSLMIYPPGYGGSPNNDMMDFGLGGLAGCPSGDTEDESGVCWTPDGIYDGLDPTFENIQITPATPVPPIVATPPTVTVPASSSSSSASDAALIAALTSAGTKALTASQTPYVIPGTSSIYNPATGQISSAVGTTLPAGYVAGTAATTTLNTFLPYLGLGALALLLFYAVKK
jgi:hypothetical protein